MNNFFNNLSNLGSGLFFGLLVFIAIFIPAVIIHEFGHLIMSRLVGVKIPEYGIGMPFTKILSFTPRRVCPNLWRQ
jgi:membrane-associated protease RseP (regulator of RpoE activity)